jgi:hypothetical protein
MSDPHLYTADVNQRLRENNKLKSINLLSAFEEEIPVCRWSVICLFLSIINDG